VGRLNVLGRLDVVGRLPGAVGEQGGEVVMERGCQLKCKVPRWLHGSQPIDLEYAFYLA